MCNARLRCRVHVRLVVLSSAAITYQLARRRILATRSALSRCTTAPTPWSRTSEYLNELSTSTRHKRAVYDAGVRRASAAPRALRLCWRAAIVNTPFKLPYYVYVTVRLINPAETPATGAVGWKIDNLKVTAAVRVEEDRALTTGPPRRSL
ncbi:hypothetical protein LSAT2_018840 [Lamellibrachia satsuma]|nr:hypothetical protein LSAT2_018840 [Lamellibrachia satsuma]